MRINPIGNSRAAQYKRLDSQSTAQSGEAPAPTQATMSSTSRAVNLRLPNSLVFTLLTISGRGSIAQILRQRVIMGKAGLGLGACPVEFGGERGGGHDISAVCLLLRQCRQAIQNTNIAKALCRLSAK